MRFTILKSIYLLMPLFFNLGQENPDTSKSEQVYIHTDRNFYIAGDNLIYKLYLKSNSAKSSRFAYFIISDEKSNAVSQLRLEIKDGISYGSIKLADTLKTGFYQIICYTNLMRNFPTTIFRKEIIIANRFDNEIINISEGNSYLSAEPLSDLSNNSTPAIHDLKILTDKKIYKIREKFNFTIVPGTMHNEDISSLSISVSQVLDYAGSFISIADFFSETSQDKIQSKINREDFTYEMESNRSVIQGIVSEIPRTINSGSNYSSPEENYTVFVSTIDTFPNLQYTQTDPTGKFCIYLDPYFEGKEVFIKLRNQADAEINLDTRYDMQEPFQPIRNFDYQKVREFIKDAVKTGQISRYYSVEPKPDTIMSFHSYHYPPVVYYKPYPRVYPADYLELENLFEISREIIPALRIRKTEGLYYASFPSLQYQVLSDEGPLIFLDGVPIDKVDQIIDLSSDDIKYIQTIPEIRYFNGIYFNGILNIVSKNNVIRKISFSKPFRQLETEVSNSFTKPKHFIPVDLPAHYPDLRYVLFWEPDFRPDNGNKMDFTIWTSDLQGEYLINVQGLTKNGIPVSCSATITVKAK